MLTVLKLTFANMKQKKFRSVLIILSILLSVALMYSVLSLSNRVTKLFEFQIRKEVGNASIMVMPDQDSGMQYLEEQNFTGLSELEYSVPLISAFGYTELSGEKLPVAFTGMTTEDYDKVYDYELLEQEEETLTGNGAWIGKETAKKYGIMLGNELRVILMGKEYQFRITGITSDKNNNLGYAADRIKLVTHPDTLSKALNLSGMVSAYYVNYQPEADQEDSLARLKAAFPQYEVRDVTDLSDFRQMITMVVTSLFLMVMAVIMVSAFIIYSSFKIIAIDRMPLMGTLRSIGATRKMTVRILLFESVFYGLTGGVLGIGLGTGILSLTMKLMLRNFGISTDGVSATNIAYMVASVAIGLILAVGSAVIPIVKTSKRSIRSIIFAELKNEKHVSVWKAIVGLFMVITGFILFEIAPSGVELMLDMIAMLLVCIGGGFIIPLLSSLLMKLLTLLLRPIYKDSIGVITANLKNDRTMMNNIMLLAMGLGVILMINNFSSTVAKAVTDVYSLGRADAEIFSEMDETFIRNVRQTEGVEHVYTTKQIRDVKANNGEITLMFLEGMDGPDYSRYAWDEFGSYLTEDVLEEFTSSRSALVTRFTAKKYGLKIGDSLEIDLDGKVIPYKIIEIVPSIMNNGNMTFVYEDFLAEDAGVINSQSMYLNFVDGIDEKEVIQQIKELMPYTILPIQTHEEMRNQNVKANNSLFFMMKAISVIAMFIGVVGILNNFTISFLSRKKLIATMRSLGLSQKKTRNNMLLEAFLCGCLGTLSGLALGTILLKSMCYVVEAMGIPSDVMFYSLKDYLFVFGSGLILALLSAVLPARSISRDNIVSGLRYE